MQKQEFYLLIDDICDVEEGTTKGAEQLDAFDSIATLSLIAMLDKKFKASFSTDELKKIGSVESLYSTVIN